ncbi:MAG: hypothetical protein ACM31L_13580 [Actinomycetota bacterium]
MNEYLRDLKQCVYEDGEIDEREVKTLRDVLATGVGEEEAELLLDLNTILTGSTYPESFEALFVDVLTRFAMDGGTALTAAKWDWLKGHLLRDNIVDELERKVLASIRAAAAEVPDELVKMLG